MADMPTWLIIVLAVIFLTPIVVPILAVIIDHMFNISSLPNRGTGDGAATDDKQSRYGRGGSCSSPHNCSSCGGGD
jgi:hypothetical protein